MHLYDLSWWVTWEQNDAFVEFTISFRSFFCTIIPGGQFYHAEGRGIILTAFRRDPISDNQSANHWTQEHAYGLERERGTDRFWHEHAHVKYLNVSEPSVGISHGSVCVCLRGFTQFLHVCGCMHVCAYECVRRHALTHRRVDGYALKQHSLVA